MSKSTLFKLIALLVAVSMLASCAPAQTATNPAPQPTQPTVATNAPQSVDPVEAWAKDIKAKYGGTELKLAVPSHPSTEAFKKLTPRFEELTGIKVVLDEMEEGALGQKLMLEIGAPTTSYDVIASYPEALPLMVDANFLEPLDSYVADPTKTPSWYDNEDILKAFRDMMIIDGKHYAAPFAGETVFLYYRTDLFEKYGIQVPKTMDELMTAAAFFKDKEPGLSGISMRTRVGWEMTYTWSVFIFPFGGEMLDPTNTKPGFTKPETVASLKYLIDLMKFAPTGVESFSFPEAWDAFMQGKTAMMVEASSAAAEVENPDKSVVAGKVGFAPMPAGPVGAYSGVWGWGYGITAKSQNKDAAYAYIMYMTSKALQADYVNNGGIVSRSSILSDPAQQTQFPYYKTTLDTLKQAADLMSKGYSVVIPIPQWNTLSDIMGTEGGKALIGQQTPEDACQKIQTQVEDLLK